MSASSKTLADKIFERLEVRDRTPHPEGDVGHGSANDITREGMRLADRLKLRFHDRAAGERRGETKTAGAATPAAPTHAAGVSMGLVHSVLRPPGMGPQMVTPPGGGHAPGLLRRPEHPPPAVRAAGRPGQVGAHSFEWHPSDVQEGADDG